ncbi:exosome complex component RRP45 [Clonorchis sinensis]|uniref:Exosome complex component RRP45 n=1 Tax=Clonorchis sinensis TaxID=79923 RepID=H2KTE0_CLOSI|nr:exosome complex component RRP45 [Clonorchis sinensis]
MLLNLNAFYTADQVDYFISHTSRFVHRFNLEMANAEILTLTDMLVDGYRLDGRSLHEYREISFRFPRSAEDDHNSCCIVNIGATSVVARVSAEVLEPKPSRPSQGMLFVNFDVTLIHPNAASRHKIEEGRRLSSVLQTLLRDSVDLDSLCIVAWERVFAIRVELRALSYDGNLGDCGALAAISALAAFRRPDVFVQDNGTVTVDTEAKYRPRVALGLRRIPVLVTFGMTADATVIVQDATAREDAILTGGRVMIGVTSFSEVCCLYTTGLTKPLRSTSLSKCVRMADSRARSLVALVNRVLDGLKRQHEAMRAAMHARSSELDATRDNSLNAPLVLSTISFLQEQVNGMPEGLEEGELVGEEFDEYGDSADDMDVVSDEADANQLSAETGIAQNSAGHYQPYGVIEVSCLKFDESGPTDSGDGLKQFSEMFDVPGITADVDSAAASPKHRRRGTASDRRYSMKSKQKSNKSRLK